MSRAEGKDEITRKPVEISSTTRETRSARQTQTSLTAFFSPTKVQAPEPIARTHRLYISDSKTRASGTLPRESDTLAGKLQVMLYKEVLDAMLLAAVTPTSPPLDPGPSNQPPAVLPSATTFSFSQLFDLLSLDPNVALSETFLLQSRPIIQANNLRFAALEARCLSNMLSVWVQYVYALGLGSPSIVKAKRSSSKDEIERRNMGRSEARLELVYRRVKAAKKSTKRRKGRSEQPPAGKEPEDEDGSGDEDRLIELAIERSLQDVGRPPDEAEDGNLRVPNGAVNSLSTSQPDITNVDTPEQTSSTSTAKRELTRQEEWDAEEDELAWAIEVSLGAVDPLESPSEGGVIVRASASQRSPPTSSAPLTDSPSNSPKNDSAVVPSSASGGIIGHSVFQHNPRLLAVHLESVLEFWMGTREPRGVSLEETRRCGWCEFEEGCEWR